MTRPKSVIDEEGLEMAFVEDIDDKAAELVASGSIVGRVTERMEYGPRALGNRSILALRSQDRRYFKPAVK
jgi:predicted NodU family carbamoyl transferase